MHEPAMGWDSLCFTCGKVIGPGEETIVIRDPSLYTAMVPKCPNSRVAHNDSRCFKLKTAKERRTVQRGLGLVLGSALLFILINVVIHLCFMARHQGNGPSLQSSEAFVIR